MYRIKRITKSNSKCPVEFINKETTSNINKLEVNLGTLDTVEHNRIVKNAGSEYE
jgi:hypothetical protein